MDRNSVKFEVDTCRGCLSNNRNLNPLSEDYAHIFFNILQQNVCVNSLYNILLCWECTAILKKISLYKKRFQRANMALLNMRPLKVKSLSQLFSYQKNEYDLSLEYNEQQAKLQIDICKYKDFEANVKCEEVKAENIDDISGEGNSDYIDYEFEIKTEESHAPKKYYTQRPNTKYVKYILENYDIGGDEYIISDRLRFKDIKHLKKDRNYTQKMVTYKTHFFVQDKIKMFNRDLKQVENNGKHLKCSLCQTLLSNKDSLRNHWDEHVFEVQKCVHCHIISIYKHDIVRHLKDSHKHKLVCNSCDHKCFSRKEFYKHYKKYHTQYKCDICDIRYTKKERIVKHMMNVHLPNKCKLCDRVYKNSSRLTAHYLLVHTVTDKQSDELTYCVECDLHFKNVFLYKRHLKTAVAHKPKTPVKVPCPDCGKIFSRRLYMKNHYNLVHKQMSKHYCEICDKYFANGYSIRTHKKFVHLKVERPRDKICQICGRGFFSNRELINHTRTHTGERPFHCSYCEAAFTQEISRKTHERTQHKTAQKTEIDVE